ncbi:ATP-dependent DNA helicase Q-like 5 [Asparagus officinalis]|nr:ATP-dependent DNA helicase Q-like 5 [Asparagus officinalis]XP_020246131.1 ATP-dependent DNA helicase Q-like 5 [Asparagus officinalis]XP_020246132.1 ATP-dependent DNA helicase Q-like 5 [Asparagus officinalis]
MESDSDSDASHVSSTPPRAQNPNANPKPRSPKPKPKKPKSRKHKLDPNPPPRPPSPDPNPPFPSPNFSILNGLTVKRIQTQPNPITSSSFSSIFKSRGLDFDPSHFEKDSNFPSTSSKNDEKIHNNKPKKAQPNFIASSSLPPEELKRYKCSSEGNFVRLNINGYGRRYSFKKGNRKFSSKFKRFRRRFVKRSEVGEEKDGDGDDEFWMESRKLDSEVEKVLEEVRREVSDNNLKGLLKVVYGYDSFREGQIEAIKKVINGESTMLVLPTGAGKSLCYQLPALILPGVTLVVSPLVALMIDQLRRLPSVIPGALLSSSQTTEEASETLHRLHEGNIKVLFVSPERFLNPEFTSMFGDSLSVSLVVIDEAHCISEWSHNFRPSFLRLRASLLRLKLNVQCFLAMTATATNRTLHDIMHALEIPESNLIQACKIRENLQHFVTLSGNRLKDLLLLMKSSTVVNLRSIIIYCKFQAEADMVSKYLCDNNIHAKGYHSGMLAKTRSRIQELFCSNKLRVVVATVAFGMGLDKSDVEAVIHYSLPESLEEYIQKTGRAGRDGRLSYCHLFVDTDTYYKLRSLSYSDGVDEYAINKLLSHIFSNDDELPGTICSLIKESASQKFDMKEEVILTILTQLELGDVQYIHLVPQVNVTCSVYFHKTPPALLSDKEPLVAVILRKSEIKNGHYVFNLPTLANDTAATTTGVLRHLQDLKSLGEITYDLKDPAFCFVLVKKPDDVFFLTTKLAKWLSEVESCKVQKLDEMFNVASFAVKECKRIDGCSETMHTPCIRRNISDYFSRDDNASCNNLSSRLPKSSRFMRADIKVFLQSNSHAKFTPRAVARIMHGIPSPAFPSTVWSKCHFWGRYMEIDFPIVMEAAAVELMDFVKKGNT